MKFSERESKVPKHNYPDSFSEQIKSLEKDSILERLNQSRLIYKDDPYRPIYHYVNPENTLNDPNGLCYWKGNWHLFYQAYFIFHPSSFQNFLLYFQTSCSRKLLLFD